MSIKYKEENIEGAPATEDSPSEEVAEEKPADLNVNVGEDVGMDEAIS